MPAPRLERVRPCLKCGALVPFSAPRCGACGGPVSGARPEDERVRSCLGCGEILRFDEDPCPRCGAPVAPDGDRVKPCAACGALRPFAETWCGECGGFTIPIPTGQIPPAVDLDDPGRLAHGWPALLGAVALAIGLATLAAAAVEIVR